MTKLFALMLAGLALATLGVITVTAQNSCDDPFGGVSPRFDVGWWETTDFCRTAEGLDYATIRSGGVPPDGIPAIDFPQFEGLAAADQWLEPQSPVIALEIDGQAKAYPLGILIWHEIVNDTLADIPVAVTYCPLCNSSIVFDRRVTSAADGTEQILTFGVSGNLRNSDLIMYDRETRSWWQQFTGEGLVGAYAGQTLTFLPSQVISFGEFSARFPQGDVLSRDTGTQRQYGVNPYLNYERNQPFLFEGEIDPRLPTMEHVLAGLLGPDVEPVAYPFTTLRAERVINDVAGGRPVVAFWQPGMVSAMDEANINLSRQIGSAAVYSRELGDRTLIFSVDADGVIRDDATNSAWNIWGEAVEGELTGQALDLQIAAPHFWFAWAAFRPETRVYGQE